MKVLCSYAIVLYRSLRFYHWRSAGREKFLLLNSLMLSAANKPLFLKVTFCKRICKAEHNSSYFNMIIKIDDYERRNLSLAQFMTQFSIFFYHSMWAKMFKSLGSLQCFSWSHKCFDLKAYAQMSKI